MIKTCVTLVIVFLTTALAVDIKLQKLSSILSKIRVDLSVAPTYEVTLEALKWDLLKYRYKEAFFISTELLNKGGMALKAKEFVVLALARSWGTCRFFEGRAWNKRAEFVRNQLEELGKEWGYLFKAYKEALEAYESSGFKRVRNALSSWWNLKLAFRSLKEVGRDNYYALFLKACFISASRFFGSREELKSIREKFKSHKNKVEQQFFEAARLIMKILDEI